jgi:S-adenosylmethionine:diacylglycerol 3-amino-3-carboxypropyl transferase
MFEDATIERRSFTLAGRVFSIASAGCTALELASHGAQVTAVDINPRQIDYVERRLYGGPRERGTADQLLAVLRRAMQCRGIRREELVTFLEMDDPSAQFQFWRDHIGRPSLRRALRCVLSRRLLRFAYASPFIDALPAMFADILWSRIERGIGTHPNRANPFAWRLFLGADPHGWREPIVAGLSIELRCADAADYLSHCPTGLFHALTLSNILDGASSDYARRLCKAVRHAAADNAIVVLRSFAEPRSENEQKLAAADRSLLWGRIVVRSIDEFDGSLVL